MGRRDADAHGDLCPLLKAGMGQRELHHGSPDRLSGLDGPAEIDPGQVGDELLAAVACHEPALRLDRRTEHTRHRDEAFVTGMVADRVVEGFEMIDIHEDDTEPEALVGGHLPHPIEAF